MSAQGLDFSVGFPVTDAVRQAISTVPKNAWQAACNADGGLREHADVVEVTGLLDLGRWTATCPGMRVIVRRELPHPGATLDAFEVRDGYRYQAFTTNTGRRQTALLDEASTVWWRVRSHGRVGQCQHRGSTTMSCVSGRSAWSESPGSRSQRCR